MVTTEPEHVVIVCSLYEFDKDQPYTIRTFLRGDSKELGWLGIDKLKAQTLLDALNANPNLIYEAPAIRDPRV
jgi:hypothetical protein